MPRNTQADSRDRRFGPARMRVGKPVNCYPSQAPPSEIPGTRLRGAAGGTQGFSTSRGIESTTAGRSGLRHRLRHPPRTACTCAWEVAFPGRREALRARRHLRHLPARTRRRSDFPSRRGGRRGLRRDGRERHQRRPHLHGAAALAARPGARARAVRDGRAAVGAARRLPRRPRRAPTSIERARARRRSARCAGHPAVLCYAIGNEIPASIVRWHGRRRIERFLERLYRAAKARGPRRAGHLRQLPDAPSTSSCRSSTSSASTSTSSRGPQFEAYLARLQNIAGDRPLRRWPRSGSTAGATARSAQARALDWQVRTAFAAGCAGHVRLRLDRRVAPRRRRHRRLGLRPGRPRPRARSRRSPRSARPSPRRRSRADPDWPRDLGGRLHLQRRAHPARLLRRAARARLPRLRGDRRQRRLDRRARPTIAARVRLPADQHREPRPRAARATRASQAATGEIVAYIDDDALPRPALADATSRPPS